MINGGHDNSLLIFEEDHQWRKGIFQQYSQGTSEFREQLRSKNIYWVSRNACWSWIIIIWGIISSVGEECGFFLWLSNTNLKNSLRNLWTHNCKILNSNLSDPFQLSQAGCILQFPLPQDDLGIFVKTLHSDLCFFPCCSLPWHW